MVCAFSGVKPCAKVNAGASAPVLAVIEASTSCGRFSPSCALAAEAIELLVEDADAAAQRQARGGRPCHADAGRDVVGVLIEQRAVVDRAVFGGDDRAGGRVDVGELVVAIEERREALVADAGGHREVVAHAPAVLRVDLPAVGVEVGLVEERQALRARQAEQEVAEAEAGVAAVGEVQLAVERPQVDVVDHVAPALDAELHRVAAERPGQVLGELEYLRGLELRPEERPAQAREARRSACAAGRRRSAGRWARP